MDNLIIPGVTITYGKGGLTTSLKSAPADIIAKMSYQLFKDYSSADEIRSADSGQLTSQSLASFKDILHDISVRYNSVAKLLNQYKSELAEITAKHEKLSRSIFRIFYTKKIASLLQNKIQLEGCQNKEQKNLDVLNIILEIDADDEFNKQFEIIKDCFEILIGTAKKWDVTSSKVTNKVAERSSASNTITRVEIRIDNRHLGLLHCDELPLVFQNMNGGDLFFYPGFLVYHQSDNKFALIDYTEMSVDFSTVRFIEDETVPDDSEIVGYTWRKVNKDGSPDRRFANNFKIPIVQYGKIHFKSQTGLNEVFQFSCHEAALLFAKAFNNYINGLTQAKSLLEQFKHNK